MPGRTGLPLTEQTSNCKAKEGAVTSRTFVLVPCNRRGKTAENSYCSCCWIFVGCSALGILQFLPLRLLISLLGKLPSVPVLQWACAARWSHSFSQPYISILHVPSARRSIREEKKKNKNQATSWSLCFRWTQGHVLRIIVIIKKKAKWVILRGWCYCSK